MSAASSLPDEAGKGYNLTTLMSPSDLSSPVKIFYSYSHRDNFFRERLGTAMALLRRRGLVEDWHDRKISPGANWQSEIEKRMNDADIIVLLVSPDFIESDYCFGAELTRALERVAEETAIVIPILVRETDVAGAPFEHMQFLPKGGQAIGSWENIDAAYKEVSIELRTAVDRLKHRRAAEMQASPSTLVDRVRENRRFDAAVASQITLNQSHEVAVQVRLEASEGLAVEIEQDIQINAGRNSYSCLPSDVRSSSSFSLPWSKKDLSAGDLELSLRLDAPGLELGSPEKKIKVQPFRDSVVFTFQIIARVEGSYRLTAQLICRDWSLAERILGTHATQPVGPGGLSVKGPGTVVASVPLVTRAKAMIAVASG